MSKPVLSIDFDGVIHSYTSGFQGVDVINDPPVDGALLFLLRAVKISRVIIYSTRCRSRKGRHAIREWLKRQAGEGMWYPTPDGPGLESVEVWRDKPPAVVHLDDRAVRFEGTFPDPKRILALKPWNKS